MPQNEKVRKFGVIFYKYLDYSLLLLLILLVLLDSIQLIDFSSKFVYIYNLIESISTETSITFVNFFLWLISRITFQMLLVTFAGAMLASLASYEYSSIKITSKKQLINIYKLSGKFLLIFLAVNGFNYMQV